MTLSWPSNKPVKLTGAYRSKGNGVLCPDRHELSFNEDAPIGPVARSLGAVP